VYEIVLGQTKACYMTM